VPGVQDERALGLPGESDHPVPDEIAAVAPAKVHVGDRDQNGGDERVRPRGRRWSGITRRRHVFGLLQTPGIGSTQKAETVRRRQELYHVRWQVPNTRPVDIVTRKTG